MKKLSIFFLGLLFIGALHAQIRKMPAEVTNTFTARYPDAKNVTWKDNLTNFMAEFDRSGSHTEAKFTTKGEWMETTGDVRFENLSAAVKDGYNKSKFSKDWQVKEVKLLEEKNKQTLYRIYISQGNVVKKYLYFNTDGQLVRDAVTL